jgi:signal transduction histidine kinase/CheY-like chemotaxis protein
MPGMIVAVPVHNGGKTVGVVMIGTSLNSLSNEVGAVKLGERGYAFVVDDRGLLVARPHLNPSDTLQDYSQYPPVKALFAGKRGAFSFTDSDGVRWLAHLERASNGWGTISLEPEEEVLGAARNIYLLAWIVAGGAIAVVVGFTWVVATRFIRPVRDITHAAVALADRKWDVPVVVDRQDELGVLASAFNRMIEHMQRAYQEIEERVNLRTEELRRSNDQLRAAREAADSANRAKDEFLTNMSHELRTPLTTILGYVDLMTQSEMPSAQRQAYLGSVQGSARHLLSIINEVLDLSSIEAGMMTVKPSAVKVCQLVKGVVANFQPRAVEKGLLLTSCCDDSVPAVIQSDAKRLQQILLNLVGNAVKFTERGQVELRVSADQTRNTIRFEVKDTGIGLTSEQIGRLFQRFVQVDSSPSRRFAGTGLGLFISRRLARMLGGDIAVTSQVGCGSSFVLTIAAGISEENSDRSDRSDASDRSDTTDVTDASGVPNAIEATSATASDEPAIGLAAVDRTGDLKGIRVLLAEDVAMNRAMLALILEKLGAAVVAVNDGRQVIDLLGKSAVPSFDAVLMDMQMPGIDGYEATAALRRMGLTLPIIALTAHCREDDRLACIAAGCTDFATKPPEAAVLLQTIRRHVEQARNRPVEPIVEAPIGN